MEPSQAKPLSEPRAVESAAARAEDAAEGGPVLGYAARVTGARRLWRWIRPGSVLFFVLVTMLAAGAGWGAWNWRLAADRKAFEACAVMSSLSDGTRVDFTHAPSREALRHLARLQGPVILVMDWPESENAAAESFAAADLGNVSVIWIRDKVNADLVLKALARPDSRLKLLTWLNLRDTGVTDAGLKELARPDCGFNVLTGLNLTRTKVTDAGVKEMSRPDSGLKALINLYLFHTNVTDAGVKSLQTARPGLRIVR